MNIIEEYTKHFVNKEFDRLLLFKTIKEIYSCKRVIYPGSFIHITPSFVFPMVLYIDNFKPAQKFFMQENEIADFIAANKIYKEESVFQYIHADYNDNLDVSEASFDLLISQYAGFISNCCKKYLRKGGYLLANNSHGDASLALLDQDYKLISIVLKQNNKYKIVDSDLELYIAPKKQMEFSKEYLFKHKKGIAYKKYAAGYIFQKVG